MKVLIPTYSLHHDPAYYPNPELFDPLRFTEDNKASRPNGTFLPFGDGPRICIGKYCSLKYCTIYCILVYYVVPLIINTIYIIVNGSTYSLEYQN